MGLKAVFAIIFFIVVVIILFFYWIIPFNDVDFGFKEGNNDFNSDNSSKGMQFYPNMRFPTSEISYNILDCPLGKKEDMVRAFEIISNKTILNFYSVQNNEEIKVTCDSKNKIEGELFIAGEGGPVNITETSNFSVIKKGQILLIKESECANPNIAIHELLHVLGFDHSENPNNIMYNVSRCNQEISQDIIDTINGLYSTPAYTDLSIKNVSAIMHGKYLDANLTVVNDGLAVSKDSVLEIYADEKLIKEFDVEELGIGYGVRLTLTNIFVFRISVDELKFVINYSEVELDKGNNNVILKINPD